MPLCPECHQEMQYEGGAVGWDMKMYGCEHDIVLLEHGPYPIIGTRTHGRRYWAKTLNGVLSERGFDDYEKKIHESWDVNHFKDPRTVIRLHVA